jgi:hypothetical protein
VARTSPPAAAPLLDFNAAEAFAPGTANDVAGLNADQAVVLSTFTGVYGCARMRP